MKLGPKIFEKPGVFMMNSSLLIKSTKIRFYKVDLYIEKDYCTL